MKDFGLQLFSIRDYFKTAEDTRTAFLSMKEMGYSYAHTAGTYDYISPEDFAKYASEAGIEICGTHYSFDRIRDDVEGTVAYHNALGTKTIGIGGMPMDVRGNPQKVENFIEEFNKCASVYAKYGFKLSYHNHSFEFVKLPDGRTFFDLLIEKLDPKSISFVLDTYWVQHGGCDVRRMIERLKGRIDILHLKDMEANVLHTLADGRVISAPGIVEIGAGNINFEDIIPLAEKCGVKYFVVEDDRCIEGKSLEYAKKSADYIKAKFMK